MVSNAFCLNFSVQHVLRIFSGTVKKSENESVLYCNVKSMYECPTQFCEVSAQNYEPLIRGMAWLSIYSLFRVM